MPARVLHLIWALDLGGAERQVVEIVRGLDRARFEPTVGCLVRKGRWGEQLEKEGVRVVGFAKRPGFDPALVLRLRRFLRRERFDVVHTHAFTAATWGRLAAALAGTPVVVAHEHSAFSLGSRPHRWTDRLLAPVTDRWVVVAEALARDLVAGERLPPRRIRVVPNGIGGEVRATGVPSAAARAALVGWPAAAVIGTIGRFEDRKALDVLLAAFARLARARGDLALALVGEGPLQGALERQARELGIAEQVRFCGRRDDVAAVLAAFDLFVLPSRTEGLSIALLEACAAARPVVATAVGGNGEVVQDGRTGVLVPPGDPTALAEAMEGLLADPARAAALGAAASRSVRERFTAARMVRSIEQVYEDALLARADTARGRFKKAPRATAVRPAVRRLVARAARVAAPGGDGLRILMYHRVNEEHPGDRLTVHPLDFDRQMAALRTRPVLSLPDAVRRLSRGERLPRGAVAITFDDGFEDNLTHAAPILERHGLTATFFVATAYTGTRTTLERYRGCCDRDGCLDGDGVRALAAAGHEIGGHSRTHRELAALAPSDARDEIEGCRRDLADALGREPSLFCYPRGSETEEVRALVAAAGFEAACSVYPGVNRPGGDPLLLRRTEVSGRDSLADFELKLAGGFDGWHRLVQGVRGLGAPSRGVGNVPALAIGGGAAAHKGGAR